ncbi:MAG TPA: hypothetical protein VM390_00160 [Acidimicrobiales bacterium]|nr:hypothetical protein [Acidimicrobiales bacterium]
MRRFLAAILLAAAAVLVPGTAAWAQAGTTLPGPGQQRPPEAEAGPSDDPAGETGLPGWVLPVAAAVVAAGGIVLIFRRGARNDTTMRA